MPDRVARHNSAAALILVDVIKHVESPGGQCIVHQVRPNLGEYESRAARALSEALARFLIGGLVVSAFAMIGGLFKPTSFAGLFGAAPSVALATLALAISKDGKSLCRHGMPFDDGGRRRALPLQHSRQPAPGQVSAIGSHGHPFRDAAMVSDRFRPVAALLNVGP